MVGGEDLEGAVGEAADDVVVRRIAGRALRSGGEQWDDVGMLQRGGEPDLTLEPLGAHPRGQLGREHFHHHLPAEPYFLGEEDATHAAAAELTLDTVGVT